MAGSGMSVRIRRVREVHVANWVSCPVELAPLIGPVVHGSPPMTFTCDGVAISLSAVAATEGVSPAGAPTASSARDRADRSVPYGRYDHDSSERSTSGARATG
jgi:hypothetical protein